MQLITRLLNNATVHSKRSPCYPSISCFGTIFRLSERKFRYNLITFNFSSTSIKYEKKGGDQIYDLKTPKDRELESYLRSRNISKLTQCVENYKNGAKIPSIGQLINAIIVFLQVNRPLEAVKVIELIQKRRIPIKGWEAYLIKRCTITSHREFANKVYELLTESPTVESDIIIQSKLMNMLIKYGETDKAWKQFEMINKSNEIDVVAWNTIIKAYIKKQPEKSIELFNKMKESGMKPDEITYLSVISSIINLKDFELGKRIHDEIINKNIKKITRLQNTLMEMYIQAGDTDKAIEIAKELRKSKKSDTVTWNMMIKAYKDKQPERSIELFKEMKNIGIKPIDTTYLFVLSACANLNELELGKKIHDEILNAKFILSLQLQNAILNLYVECGDTDGAWNMFLKMKDTCTIDSYTWSIILKTLSVNKPDRSLELLNEIEKSGIEPDRFIYTSLISSINKLKDFELGKKIHDEIISKNIELSTRLQNTLMDMYIRAGDTDKAIEIFEDIKKSNKATDVTWNIMIKAFIDKQPERALEMFHQMKQLGFEPNAYTNENINKLFII